MKLYDFAHRKQETQEAQPLRVEGVPAAPLTPEPDDAELAAQALLEMMISLSHGPSPKGKGSEPGAESKTIEAPSGAVGGADASYYQALANKIRAARKAARMRTNRFLSFCEQELKKPDLPKEGEKSLALLETELYKRMDTVDREGGDIKARWQRCLAVVTARLLGFNID